MSTRPVKVDEESLYRRVPGGFRRVEVDPDPPPEKRFFKYEEVDGHTRLTPEQSERLDLRIGERQIIEYLFYCLTKQYLHRGDVNGHPALDAAWDPADEVFVVSIDPKVYRRFARNYSSTFDGTPIRYLDSRRFKRLRIEHNVVVR